METCTTETHPLDSSQSTVMPQIIGAGEEVVFTYDVMVGSPGYHPRPRQYWSKYQFDAIEYGQIYQ